ncbi:putative sporulation protein YtxC [Paenibacillus sp. ATY16]|uniref:putative sporulation protein YtxC n=1 Tax=Paenibacillus sp. ATY16 TaxID=1759312 RepID=UPI00200DD970|nr:putative sporulation protein YtxC [Paenibacillus sp. ATY16]MCK9862405.1 putative sporulation protein YtxC [Paenibacillus sp. ATY16]
MELFTVTLPSNMEQSAAQLAALMAEYTTNDLHIAHIEEDAIQYTLLSDKEISCQAILPYFQLANHSQSVLQAASKALAEFIVTDMEPLILAAIIRRKYRNNHAIDAPVIEKYCHELLHGTEWDGLGTRFLDADRQRRKTKVAEEIDRYLQENSVLHLDGLTSFRLLPYRTELAEIVDYALDEYVLDKQYQEFISLLKYFVGLQESKVPIVHLVHKGSHDFVLFNEKFQPFEPKPHSDKLVAEMLETEMNIEDMVISSLIAVSPKHIMIHTRQDDMQVIRTIETIFDNRVSICTQCPACSPCFEGNGTIQPDSRIY